MGPSSPGRDRMNRSASITSRTLPSTPKRRAGLGPGQPLHYELGGNMVLVRNLALDQPWKLIHHDLLSLAKELAAWPVAVGA